MQIADPIKVNMDILQSKPQSEQRAENKNQETQTDLGVLKDYKRDLVKPADVHTDNGCTNPLDRFLWTPNMKFSYFHGLYYYHNRATSPTLRHLSPSRGIWAQSPLKLDTICPWKMHIFADTEEDWAKLTATVGRYLNTQRVTWKTLSSKNTIEKLNKDTKQKGKAFTVYTSSQEQFKKLAKDIDYIIRLNHLETKESQIDGDRQLGGTGRIFYRYEHKSGATKDATFAFANDKELREYNDSYEPNRQGDKYLAADMTPADDPFYNFDPRE